MAVGFDFGTAIIVAARQDEQGEFTTRSERNCFIDLDKEKFEELLGENDYSFLDEKENGVEKKMVFGKDAIRLANLFKLPTVRRPMKNMILNSKSDPKAIKMLKYMTQGLLGPAKEGEVCYFSIPADPIDKSQKTTFHEEMCGQFVEEMGYTAIPINEALAVIFATNPTVTSEDGEEMKYTGIGISFGGGGVNGCLAYKGVDTIKFSLPRSGDWIDESVAEYCRYGSPSEVTVVKEKKSRLGEFDLSKFNYEDDDVLNALYVYYKRLLKDVAVEFQKLFIANKTNFTDPIEIVVSGGTAMPNGFEKMLEQQIKAANWPFEIKGVRKAKDPLTTTALGCLAAALKKESKNAVN